MLDSKDLVVQSPKKDPLSDEYTEVYVWGDNNHGQLGLGKRFQNSNRSYLAPSICSFSLVIKEISCGEEHAAFVTSIGNRSITQSFSPCLVEACQKYNCIQISCGWGHTVALMSTFLTEFLTNPAQGHGEIYVWGIGEYGALGTGRRDTEWTPTKIYLDDRISLGASKVSAGGRHTGFVSELREAYVCGSGESGQLGIGISDKDILSPQQVTGIKEKLRDIACGSCHTLFLTDYGRVYTTGNNKYGQLGIGSKRSSYIPIPIQMLEAQRISKIACWNHSACLTERGELYIWGTGVFGEYLSPTRFSKGGVCLKEISVGNFFGAALEDNGRIWVWGSNNGGELGLGDYEPRIKPVVNEYLSGKKTGKVSCGGNFMMALGPVAKNKKLGNGVSSVGMSLKKSVGGSEFRTPEKGEEMYWQNAEAGDIVRTSLEDIVPIQKTEPKSERESIEVKRERESLGRISLRQQGNLEREDGSRGRVTTEPQEDVRRGNQVIDLRYVELLEKQKLVLEKSLRYEREDKLTLQKTIRELTERMQNLEEGPEGVLELNEKLRIKSRNLEELQESYDNEVTRREKTAQDLYEERNKVRKLLDRVREQEETIGDLRRQMEKYKTEAIDKARAVEVLQQELEEEKKRNLELIEEKLSIEDTVFKLREECKERRINLERTDQNRDRLLEEKHLYEQEAKTLENQMRKLDESLVQSMKDLEREDLIRRQLEAELEQYMRKLDDAQEEINRLGRENERLRWQFREETPSQGESLRELNQNVDKKRILKKPNYPELNLRRGTEENAWGKQSTAEDSMPERRVMMGRENTEPGRAGNERYEDEDHGDKEWKITSESERKYRRELTFRNEDSPKEKLAGPLENLKQVRERLEFLKNSKEVLEGKLADFHNKISEMTS